MFISYYTNKYKFSDFSFNESIYFPSPCVFKSTCDWNFLYALKEHSLYACARNTMYDVLSCSSTAFSSVFISSFSTHSILSIILRILPKTKSELLPIYCDVSIDPLTENTIFYLCNDFVKWPNENTQT